MNNKSIKDIFLIIMIYYHSKVKILETDMKTEANRVWDTVLIRYAQGQYVSNKNA